MKMEKQRSLEDKVKVAVEFNVRFPESEDISSNNYRYTIAVKKGTTWNQFLEESGIERATDVKFVNKVTLKYDTLESIGLTSAIYDIMFIPMDFKIMAEIYGVRGIYNLDLVTENPETTLREVDDILRRYDKISD